jgi:hypothetical protein
MPPSIQTVREHIAWSYANLGRADAALKDKCTKYSRIHHIIRSRLFNGLVNDKMKMRSLYDDERIKMIAPQACYYCGSREKLSVDHLIPKIKGGADESDNLIWACRSCNSSKHGRDMLSWLISKGKFPAILLLRRYIKIVARYCDQRDLMDMNLQDVCDMDLPFDLRLLPYKYPPLPELKLWVNPEQITNEEIPSN